MSAPPLRDVLEDWELTGDPRAGDEMARRLRCVAQYAAEPWYRPFRQVMGRLRQILDEIDP